MHHRQPKSLPGFEQVVLAVIEQDLGLPPLGEDALRSSLARVPFESAFAQTARIDAVIRHGAQHGHADDAQLRVASDVFDGHPKRESLLELMASQGRSLFSTPYIHAIQRLLVQEASDTAQPHSTWQRHMQAAFLGMSNVVSPDEARPDKFELDYFLALMTRSAVANATEPLIEAISRAYAIYHELPRRTDAPAMPNYMPRERWEPDPANAPTVHERLTAGMAVLGAIGVFDARPPQGPAGVPADYFDVLANQLSNGDASRLSRAISTDRAGLKAAFARGSPELRHAVANAIPFQVWPLLRSRDGTYLLSSTNALASWMTRGVHYACLTPLEGTSQGHQFLTYVGRLFEAYARELVAHAHREQTDVRVLGEQPYDRGSSHTADIAVADGVDLVLIEVEARRFSRDALLSSNPQRVVDELRTMVVDKARQLDQCITALMRTDSPARLDGVAIDAIERIWPVVVVEGAIGQSPILRDYLKVELADALGQPHVQKLTIVSMAELERLCALIECGHRLALTLRRWKEGSRRDNDFHYFCSTKPDLKRARRASLIRDRWSRLNADLAAAFTPATRARLQNP